MKHAGNTDAKTRAGRTLVQGLVIAVLLAVAGVITNVIGGWTGHDFTDITQWSLLATALIQAVLTSAASFIQRTLEGERNE